jgi:hypothetical protein
VTGPATVPEPGAWWVARRTAGGQGPARVHLLVLAPDAGPDERAALARRHAVLQSVEDPRIPPVIGLFDGVGALAISAIDAAPLQRAVDARRDGLQDWRPATIVDSLVEIAETVQAQHAQGRCHGRLSPANVALDLRGRVWLYGWGAEGPADARYVAPEVARGETAGPAADQWAIAAIGLALWTGRTPWTDAAAARRGTLEGSLDALRRSDPAAARVFGRALESLPSSRHPNLQPFRQELLALARRTPGVSDRRGLGTWLVSEAFEGVDDAPTPVPPERGRIHRPLTPLSADPASAADATDVLDGGPSPEAVTVDMGHPVLAEVHVENTDPKEPDAEPTVVGRPRSDALSWAPRVAAVVAISVLAAVMAVTVLWTW